MGSKPRTPRNSQSSRRTTTTSSSSEEQLLLDVDLTSRDGDGDGGDNEKEAKIKQEQKTRFQQFMYLFALLAVAAFILGTASSKNKNKIKNNEIEMKKFPPKPNNNNIRNNNNNNNQDNPNPVIDTEEEVEGEEVIKVNKPPPSIHDLELKVEIVEESVRERKQQPGILMETDDVGLQLTHELQHATRELIEARYGNSPKRVKVDVKFPPTIPDYTPESELMSFQIEMAPYDLLPVSVNYFLEIVRTYKGGAFHRNAAHVLQASAFSNQVKPMPFQEYSYKHPHTKYTTGYAGRPSGPGWYVSIMDNTKNHGPGSQQKKNPNEADSNFGELVSGMHDVIPRIHSIPQKEWLSEKNKMKIIQMTILVPKYSSGTEIEDWIPWTEGMIVNKPE